MTESTTLPTRKQVLREQTWDLESIFPTPTDWEAACQELTQLLTGLSAYQGRLKEGPQTLLAYLRELEPTSILMGKIMTYASNAYSVDTNDQDAAARVGQARSIGARYGATLAFFDPELVEIGFTTLHAWITATPELGFFAHYVDRLEKARQHVRSGEVEEVLALAGDPFSGPFAVYSALNSADLTFRPAIASDGAELEVGQASMGSLITHADREVRRTAWENYSDSYLAFKNTYAAALTAAIKQDVFRMHTRRYETCLQASLEPNHIPVEVFHNLIEVFQQNLPTWHRYWRLRGKALGYDQFHVYDIKAPLSTDTPVVPFDRAVDWICEGMAPLGEEYVAALRKGCQQERWVDRARNKGKRDGAFSSGGPGMNPFIMMSYADDLYSLSTLAHELGHSLHTYYTCQAQPTIYARYGLFVAEVASNFNQAMVREHLLRTQTGRDFQIALIEEAMSNYHRYFFIMPTLARFELEMHTRAEKGAPLSAEVMIGTAADLFKEGYGDEVIFERDRIGITWAQFLHMYMNFYVYQYATGISGAHALAHAINAGDPGAAGRYLDFLRAGGSVYPLEALKKAGVDLTTTEPVERAFEVLSGLVDRLEGLVG
ncbi:MAG: oligoendopeptidase F [Anaerolineales bacterium]|nr:oligoendopeptidase F [Anaerolineales bacterium]